MGIAENVIYGVVGVSGIGAAVGLPLGMKKVGINKNHNLQTVDLKVCESTENDNNSEIKYGAETDKNVCGKGSDGTSNTYPSEYTEVLQDNGSAKVEDFGGRDGRGGTGQCLKDEENKNNVQFQGTINVQKTGDNEEKTYYAGLCGGNSLEGTKFIKKQKAKVDSGSEASGLLGTCDQNCGETTNDRSGVKELTKEKQNSWREVKFYSPKKQDITKTD